VVSFSGDGSLLMNIQELVTAVEENVNVKIVVMNNNSLGLVHQQQDLFYGQRIFAADYERAVDFIKIAEGFGMRAIDLGQSGEPQVDLARAIREDGPCLIHVPIDVNEKVYPMVPPGAANKDMIGGESRPARAESQPARRGVHSGVTTE
jgi:acetolactate synthase-1/2/3 large subunit